MLVVASSSPYSSGYGEDEDEVLALTFARITGTFRSLYAAFTIEFPFSVQKTSSKKPFPRVHSVFVNLFELTSEIVGLGFFPEGNKIGAPGSVQSAKTVSFPSKRFVSSVPDLHAPLTNSSTVPVEAWAS